MLYSKYLNYHLYLIIIVELIKSSLVITVVVVVLHLYLVVGVELFELSLGFSEKN